MDPEKGGDNFIEKNQHGDHFLDYSIKKVKIIFLK